MLRNTDSDSERTNLQPNDPPMMKPERICVDANSVIRAYQQNRTNTNSQKRIGINGDGSTKIVQKNQHSNQAEIARIEPEFVVDDPGTDPHVIPDDEWDEFIDTWADILTIRSETAHPYDNTLDSITIVSSGDHPLKE